MCVCVCVCVNVCVCEREGGSVCVCETDRQTDRHIESFVGVGVDGNARNIL